MRLRRDTSLQGPRVMLRPLEVGDHGAWREIRIRGRDWLEPWEPFPDGMNHAIELVRMAGDLGGFCVGVAAFPEGHPDAPSLEGDAEVLVEKARAGAEYAITQLFFRASDYFDLVARVRGLDCDIPVIPGIMPILNFAQVARMAELSGAAMPDEVLEQIED